MLAAQQPTSVNDGPVPSQIAAAKRAFIANGGGVFDPHMWSGKPTRTYNEFYSGIKSWGHYELVGSPADADLVLEISFDDRITGVSVTSGGGGSTNDPQFILRLRDPKTGILLWWMKSHVPVKFGVQKSRDAHFDDAMTGLVDDSENADGTGRSKIGRRWRRPVQRHIYEGAGARPQRR